MTADMIACPDRRCKPLAWSPDLAPEEGDAGTISGMESRPTAAPTVPSTWFSTDAPVEFGGPDSPESVPSRAGRRFFRKSRKRLRLETIAKRILKTAMPGKRPRDAKAQGGGCVSRRDVRMALSFMRKGHVDEALALMPDLDVEEALALMPYLDDKETLALMQGLDDGSRFLDDPDRDDPVPEAPANGRERRYRREDASELAGMLNGAPQFKLNAMRRLLKFALELVMEVEVRRLTGADRGRHDPGRKAQLNGVRKRKLTTPLGEIVIGIPTLRWGPSYLPSFLDPKSAIVAELSGIVRKAWIGGMSTRTIGGLFGEGTAAGLSKSSVSRLCEGASDGVDKFHERRLDGNGRKWAYIWLDATYVNGHVLERAGDDVSRRVKKRAVVIAKGVDDRGGRAFLGIAVGDSETREFWGGFLTSLRNRGLGSPKLAVTDGNAALRAVAAELLPETDLQLCRVHWMREVLRHVPWKSKKEAAEILTSIFEQETPETTLEKWKRATEEFRRRWTSPKIARKMTDEKRDALLVYTRYPKEHWPRLSGTNPIERQNLEVKRRTDVVCIFPNDRSIERLVGARMIDANEKWTDAEPYMLPDLIEAVMNGSAIGDFIAEVPEIA